MLIGSKTVSSRSYLWEKTGYSLVQSDIQVCTYHMRQNWNARDTKVSSFKTDRRKEIGLDCSSGFSCFFFFRDVPVFQYCCSLFSDVAVLKHSCVPVFRCSCFPVFLFSEAPVFRCSCFPVFFCFHFKLLLFPDVPVFQCSCFSVPVVWTLRPVGVGCVDWY